MCSGDESQRMSRNHQLFVGRHDIKADTAVGRRDACLPAPLACRVELGAEPGEPIRDALADQDRVLADAGGKDEGVDPAERRRQHSGIQADPINEIIDREGGAGIAARLKLTHVVLMPDRPLSPQSL